MTFPFFKYQGTGNDFVIVDQRTYQFLSLQDQALIQQLCDRRFGIGADGLMLIQNKTGVDFEMIYFNADGRRSSMCGNGGRCIVSLAAKLGIFSQKCSFEAIDGIHQATIDDQGIVSLKMNDVYDIEQVSSASAYILDTGSPHYVAFHEELNNVDMVHEGKAIRYNDRFKKEGINVNLAKFHNNILSVRTYERGVEAETFSCGTGVVASAISLSVASQMSSGTIDIDTLGGPLSVSFKREGDKFTNVWLKGAATFVFEGVYEI